MGKSKLKSNVGIREKSERRVMNYENEVLCAGGREGGSRERERGGSVLLFSLICNILYIREAKKFYSI
jgi:hypothetical protein